MSQRPSPAGNPSSSEAAGPGADAEFAATCLRALPIWRKQVEISRVQTEEAIGNLGQQFEAMVSGLNAGVTLFQTTADDLGSTQPGGSGGVLAQSRVELLSVLETLRTLQECREAVVAELRALTPELNALRTVADEAAAVSSITTTLALGAEAAAARGDEAAKGLVAVAEQARHLSRLSQDTADRLSAKVATLSRTLATTDGGNNSVGQVETRLQRMLQRFEEATARLSGSAEQLRREGAGIKDSIEQSIVHFQSQDRVSQILSHVESGIARLVDSSGPLAEGKAGATHAVLAEMERTYTTEEERQAHSGQTPDKVVPQEVTFF